VQLHFSFLVDITSFSESNVSNEMRRKVLVSMEQITEALQRLDNDKAVQKVAEGMVLAMLLYVIGSRKEGKLKSVLPQL
jgi:hypothetical protein